MMEKEKSNCTNCRRKLEIGVDVICVEDGVIGMKGLIPLGKPMLFCSEKCLCDYFDMSDLPSCPGRIP